MESNLSWSGPQVSGSGSLPPGWCLHAQLTISHCPVVETSSPDRNNLPSDNNTSTGNNTSTLLTPTTSGAPSGSNVHFEYSWKNTTEQAIPSEVIPNESGIQKFESWPRSFQFQTRDINSSTCTAQHGNLFLDSAGYGHEPNVLRPQVIHPRLVLPYDRRCKSTCSITLSNNSVSVNNVSPGTSSNNPTLSLNRRSVSAHAATRMSPKHDILVYKDVETQTCSERLQMLTSKNPVASASIPFHKIGGIVDTTIKNLQMQCTRGNDDENDEVYEKRKRKHGGSFLSGNERSGRMLTRKSSYIRAKSTPPIRQEQKTSQPRTIHIDVYCTASDASTNTEPEGDEGSSTPQTVFESPLYKIVHQQKRNQLPLHYNANVGDGHASRKPMFAKAKVMEDLSRSHKVQTTDNYEPTTVKSALFQKKDYSLEGRHTNDLQVQASRSKNLSRFSSEVDHDHRISATATTQFAISKNLSRDSCDSTRYPSSIEMSRNSTMSSIVSDGTQMDRVLTDDHDSSWKESEISNDASIYSLLNHDEQSKDILDTDSTNRHEHIDSLLLDKPLNIEKGNEEEFWWMDYIFKKFDIAEKCDRDNINTEQDDKIGANAKNNAKRLSFPNMSTEDFAWNEKMLPPFLVTPTVAYCETNLNTATKFGTVVKAFKKPGHHIGGPTKNPNCSCEHCRFHFENIELGNPNPLEHSRARAYSLDNLGSLSNEASSSNN